MKPVFQDQYGEPNGNCFQACIASILELSLTEVPNFCQKQYLGKTDNWVTDVARWLTRFGLWYIDVQFGSGIIVLPDGYYIASGAAPRGHRHSVVAKNGKMVHDPHPSTDGLKRPDEFGFFIILDPKRSVERKLSKSPLDV